MDLRAVTETQYASLVMLVFVSMRWAWRMLDAEAESYDCAARSSSSVEKPFL